MPLDISNPLIQIKITSAVCSFVAICTTVFRLYLRRNRYWADDAWSAVALICLVIQVVSVFLHLPLPNNQSKTTRVAAYYLMAYTFYAVIWTSRLSILYSIVRIDPDARRRRQLAWVASFFVVATVFLMSQLLWVCEPIPNWKDAPNPQCPLPQQVAICQLITDILADAMLLIAPLRVFRTLADKVLRRRLSVIFSTCVATTIVSLVHAAYIIRRGGIRVIISALVEDCASLIVANLPVVISGIVSLQSEERDYVQTFPTISLKFNKLARSEGTTTLGGVNTTNQGTVATLSMPPGLVDDERSAVIRGSTDSDGIPLSDLPTKRRETTDKTSIV